MDKRAACSVVEGGCHSSFIGNWCCNIFFVGVLAKPLTSTGVWSSLLTEKNF